MSVRHLTAAEVAERLRLPSLNALYLMVHRGTAPRHIKRPGPKGKLLFPERYVEAWEREHTA
jgi:hypothetical protein